MPPFRFQLLSDLHLETPLSSPSYTYFSNPNTLPIHAPHLFLLGDIDLVNHPQLFTFLSRILENNSDVVIYYLMGNHEAYGTTLEIAIEKLQTFEDSVQEKYAGIGRRFVFLNRTRIDISPTLTLLGCTLWTHIPTLAHSTCADLLTDFNESTGIWDRSVHEHNLDHARDVEWLNQSVKRIAETELEREIVVLTHHSPTIDSRANSVRHAKSSVRWGFRTDLSRQECWTSERVKVWGFGHTHYNCQFWDEVESGHGDGLERNGDGGGRKKLVLANQKGYGQKGIEVVVVERGEEGWRVGLGAKESLRDSPLIERSLIVDSKEVKHGDDRAGEEDGNERSGTAVGQDSALGCPEPRRDATGQPTVEHAGSLSEQGVEREADMEYSTWRRAAVKFKGLLSHK
ncbi:hypothetical protein BKA63DRAFT_501617 [Paraphoma chrysanthemicola]|nr:hypothetical protein BKA63DRAFT_501617 [Paraphoma chrysanthemicola]